MLLIMLCMSFSIKYKNKQLVIGVSRKARSISLLGLQVAAEAKEWMVLAIDKYDYGMF